MPADTRRKEENVMIFSFPVSLFFYIFANAHAQNYLIELRREQRKRTFPAFENSSVAVY